MAISYLKDVSETNLLFSHNNNIIEFSSDSALTIRDCIITVGTNIVTLYPNPYGVFYYNFNEIVASLINSNNYTDDLNADVSVSYFYDWVSRNYLSLDVDISINFTNDTSDQDSKTLQFLLSSVNLRDYNNRFPFTIGIDQINLMLPLVNSANNKYYAKYFNGYPFDVTVYRDKNTALDMDIDNLTNAQNITYDSIEAELFRFVFSDGRTDTSLEDVFPLITGLNNIRFRLDGSDDKFLELEKQEGCNGVYLKWLNNNGGYSYWLFTNNAGRRGYKERGYINNDFENIGDTVSQDISLGLDSKDALTVYDSNLNENQKNLIATILDSPKVYLFTGAPFSQNNFNDWMEVKNKTRRYDLKQVKRDLYNISLSFELPNNYNIYL